MHPQRLALSACLAMVLLATAACATIGGRFGEDISRLQVGVTTEPQAVAVLGSPTASAPVGQGMTKVTWARVSDAAGSIRHSRTVTVVFGADGKMAKLESRTNAYNIVDRKAAPAS